MKNLILICLAGLMFAACEPRKPEAPIEPHLELGQRITFPGAEKNIPYIVLGYKSELDGRVEKVWKNQDYIVFLYENKNGDLNQAVIHQNAILKD
ncbi:hypothetical protein AB9P05_04045 [Roseivirga sp. BDSF3-8]|uniref:hypothetical protein n=1 Tax=Roseivirga sp. BDSF3-8 TaxID=3241598 RepID=UPI003531840B